MIDRAAVGGIETEIAFLGFCCGVAMPIDQGVYRWLCVFRNADFLSSGVPAETSLLNKTARPFRVRKLLFCNAHAGCGEAVSAANIGFGGHRSYRWKGPQTALVRLRNESVSIGYGSPQLSAYEVQAVVGGVCHG